MSLNREVHCCALVRCEVSCAVQYASALCSELFLWWNTFSFALKSGQVHGARLMEETFFCNLEKCSSVKDDMH